MILDPSGSPYQPVGDLRQFDPENPEHDLFNLWDQEAIRIGGSPIYYYEVFIQSGTTDPLYREDRGKIFSNCPIELFAVYEPIPSQHALGTFGYDSPDEMVFDVNHQAVIKAIGHAPKIGSRIFTPHLRENWQVVQCNRGEFKLWGALRMQILAQRFQESVTTGEGRVAQKSPDFRIGG